MSKTQILLSVEQSTRIKCYNVECDVSNTSVNSCSRSNRRWFSPDQNQLGEHLVTDEVNYQQLRQRTGEKQTDRSKDGKRFSSLRTTVCNVYSAALTAQTWCLMRTFSFQPDLHQSPRFWSCDKLIYLIPLASTRSDTNVGISCCWT